MRFRFGYGSCDIIKGYIDIYIDIKIIRYRFGYGSCDIVKGYIDIYRYKDQQI